MAVGAGFTCDYIYIATRRLLLPKVLKEKNIEDYPGGF